MHDWFFEGSSIRDVLVGGISVRSCLDSPPVFLALFFQEKTDIKFHLQCLMVGEQACSCLTRPQEGGAYMVGMKSKARSLKV